jgi:UDP:flavonoid glycosyltransferase YjiC (YdhE family)
MKSEFHKPILLFFPMDMLSHHLRCLQLADAIKDLATCIFATEKYKELIESRGHESVFYKSLSAEMILKMGQQGDSSWVSVKNLEPVIERQIQIIHNIKPDYVINDYSFTAHLAAEYLNTPCISLINGLFTKHLAIPKGIPTSHPMSKFSFLLPNFIIQNIQEFIFKILHRPYRQLRKIFGLSLINRSFLDEFKGNINLVLDTAEFAPQTHLPKDTYFLGPLYHSESKVESQILDQLDSNKKTILVNMGSGGLIDQVAYLNDSIFNKYNILVIGDQANVLSANHIFKAKFLSLESIMPKVDLVLNQGGTGNIFQSLAHGVPVFCYPTFFEQDWNSIRVQELEYGLHLTGKESLESIKELIEVWSNKKEETKFKLLSENISVEKSKIRFRKIMLNIFNPKPLLEQNTKKLHHPSIAINSLKVNQA